MKLDSSRVHCSLQSQRKLSHSFKQSGSLSPVPATAFKRMAYGTRLAQTFWKLATAHCARWLVQCSPSEMCLGQHADREWWLGHLFQQYRDAQSRLSKELKLRKNGRSGPTKTAVFSCSVSRQIYLAPVIQFSSAFSVWHLKNAQIKSFV